MLVDSLKKYFFNNSTASVSLQKKKNYKCAHKWPRKKIKTPSPGLPLKNIFLINPYLDGLQQIFFSKYRSNWSSKKYTLKGPHPRGPVKKYDFVKK